MTNKQTIDGVSREQQHIKGMVEAAGGEYAVMIDPENRHFGWTFKRCPNGQWVSGRKATDAEMHAAHQYAKSTYQSGGNDYRNELLSIAQSLREYSGNPHHIDPVSDAFKKLIMNASEALSKAAQPKGEVERLREELEIIRPERDLYKASSETMEDFWRETQQRLADAEKRVAIMEKALTRIAREHDCGCWPCTGSCVSQTALEITVEAMREIASDALKPAVEGEGS